MSDVKTEKQDWLNDFLASHSDMLVSSHANTSDRFDLTDSETVEVRFIGHRSTTDLYLITIESDQRHWDRVKRTLQDSSSANRIANRLRSVLSPPHVITLLYDNNNQGFFSASSGLSEFKDIGSVELQRDFAKINSGLVDDIGVEKKINESINDSFQKWTRKYLTKYVTINDFDAIFVGDEPAIYELKRIQESVESWYPYVDDEPNYAALMYISDNCPLSLRTVAYNPDAKGDIGYHFIESTEKKNIYKCEGSITGQKCISDQEGILEPFPKNDREVVDRYKSRIFRVPYKCRDLEDYTILGWDE